MLERRRILVLAVLVAIAGCDKKTSSSSGPDKAVPPELQPTKAQVDTSKLAAPALFAHIPADTPYIVASFEAVSLDYYGKLKQGLAPTFGKLLQKKRDLSGGAQEPDLFDAIVDELDGKLDVQRVEALGLTATPRFAVYGLGVAPVVMRVEIRDEATLRATIERVATKAGETLPPQETKDGKAFWRFRDDNDDSTAIVAILDKQLIAAIGPTAEVERKLDLILGIEQPAQSMADGKTLIEVMTRHGFGPQLIGYVDTRKLATQAFALAEKQPPAGCTAAVDALAAKAPRLAFGYTEISGKRASGGMVIELEASVLAELAALRTEVPGLGTALSDAPLMAMGGGVDLAKGAALITKAATAVRAVGEACQAADVVEAASEAIDAVSQPLPPPAAKITGFAGAIHTFELGPSGVDKVDGFGMVTATSTKELIALIKDQVPLDMIGLTTDGKLNKLDIPAGVVPVDVVGGVGDKAIVVGAGSKGKALAERGLSGSASGKSPFFVATYDYGRFLELQANVAKITGNALDPDDAVSRSLGSVFGRASFSLDVNDKGLVMWAAIDLK